VSNGQQYRLFLTAIRFVLSDAYALPTREQRQALLHDSSASVSATLSAFVEIVFDNSDGRFPYGSNNEVTLRRTVGARKDEYTLDRKNVKREEIMSMLEAAGFSRSNPYYIVPQGRVSKRRLTRSQRGIIAH
jgi:structural maintenance of chromosome 3 (chondroitin sulfate proteoglycan 6)